MGLPPLESAITLYSARFVHDRLDVERAPRRRAGLVLVVEVKADSRGRERDRDIRDCTKGAIDHARTTGIPLVEDDHARGTRCLRVGHLRGERAGASLDQRDAPSGEAWIVTLYPAAFIRLAT